MSEELEALGALDEEQLPDDIVEDQEEETPELNAAEQKAWDGGWRPEDQFDGNPENWKTAREYNLYGEMQGQIREAKAETRREVAKNDERITNLNKLHSAQQKSALADLKAQQREAVEEADTDKYDKIQTQIDSNKAEDEVTTPTKDPAVAEWEAKNAWINDTGSEKYAQAQAAWGIAASRGMDNQAALDFVDSQQTVVELSASIKRSRSTATLTVPAVPATKPLRSRLEMS